MTATDAALVVKIGGGEGLDLDAACDDLARIADERSLVIVHGVSAIMDRICRERGIEVQSLRSPSGHASRYTPPQLRDIYVEAAESANAGIIAALNARGLNAKGFVGDNVAIHAERKRAIRALKNGRVRIVRDDHSGVIRGVDGDRLRAALAQGATPVLPPMASSGDGLLNVDGDRAGAMVAGELRSRTLIILSNVRGLYQHFPDESSFVAQVRGEQLDEAMEWARGRMKRKVLAAREALQAGVPRVIIADGRSAHPVTRALDGAGTRFGI